MNNILKLIYIISVFVILSIPVGLMGVYEGENSENRVLAQMPDKITENFGSEFESYIADNFAFRDKLVNADSYIKAELFGMSGNDKVTVGKEDWLFFTETLEDITSKNLMSDREIYSIVRTLELISEYAENNNSRFIFTIAPNKASLYSQYLPYYYKKSNVPNNMERIVEKLENVEYLDLKNVFENQDEILYHRLDSHWNNKGAELALNSLLELLNLDKKEYSQPQLKTDWQGDLSEMLFPTMDYRDDQYYYNENEFNYNYIGRFKSVDDMKIETQNEYSNNGSILVFRDSFGRSLLPFIGDNFSRSTLLRSTPYDLTNVSDYDYTVIEIVERNLDNLISKAPYMEAQISDKDIEELTLLSKDDYTITREDGELCHLYGNISCDLSTESRIYIMADNTLYEAFPTYELDEDEVSTGDGKGFSIYLNKNVNNINIYISKGE